MCCVGFPSSVRHGVNELIGLVKEEVDNALSFELANLESKRI